MTTLDQQSDAFHVWHFPTMDLMQNPNEEHHKEETSPEEQQAEVNLEEKKQLIDEITELKKAQLALHEKIHYLDEMGSHIKKVCSEMDEQLLTDIVGLIKTTVKKIVLKELALDKDVLHRMILSALETLHQENEALLVCIAPEDQALVAACDPLQQMDIKVDSTLTSGDFIIKTKSGEIAAILEQHLNTLFGV